MSEREHMHCFPESRKCLKCDIDIKLIRLIKMIIDQRILIKFGLDQDQSEISAIWKEYIIIESIIIKITKRETTT